MFYTRGVRLTMLEKILEYYKQTSMYTDLGYYTTFVQNLSNDIKELCILQRKQIIHPNAFKDEKIREKKNCFWGNMTEIPLSRLIKEDDIFPTAQSVLAELLRRDNNYSVNREAKNKINVTCRSQSLLLSATLKAKNIPARTRSGFAKYPSDDDIYWDHWITEYYDKHLNRWVLVDADCCLNDVDFNIYDIPRNEFLFSAEVWLKYRNKTMEMNNFGHAAFEMTEENYNRILIPALFYDFHCIMNNEIIYLHEPKYAADKKFQLTSEELIELDNLAKLMLDPDENFEALLEIWNNNLKYRIMTGALN